MMVVPLPPKGSRFRRAGALRRRTPLIALVHQPLALDPGLGTAQAETFRETERAALAAAARVIVTSAETARIVIAHYDVSPKRISVVRPGTDPVPPAPGSNDGVVAAQVDADIARHHLGDRITVLGAVSHEHIDELFLGSDVFVLASRFEGTGWPLQQRSHTAF
jgi:hypothetical protein